MALPTSRQTLINYCRQELGEPVIQVNISQSQAENAVDNALQYWREYHADAQERTFLAIQLTQPQIDSKTVILPPNVTSVLRVVDPNTFGGSSIGGESLFDFDFQFMSATVWDMMSFGGAVGYYVTKQYLAELDTLLSPAPQFRFRQHTNQLHIDANLAGLLSAGKYLLVECHAWLDEVDHSKVWSDPYLRELTTGFMKKYWGEILKKFGGVTLPSGIQLNGQVIFDEAVQQIELAKRNIKLHEEPFGIITA